MSSSYHDWLSRAERLEKLRADCKRRSVLHRKLAAYGVEQEIAGGCGTVRVNASGTVRAVELNLANARVAGERRLADWLVKALSAAREQAERLAQLISEQ